MDFFKLLGTDVHRMISLFNILQLELHVFPAAVILIFLLPFSTNPRVRYYGCFALYIFLMSFVAMMLIPIFIFRPKNVHNALITSYCLKHIAKLFKIEWELRGGEILEVDRGAVIVANHQTMFDILGMFQFWNIMDKCATVAKKELFYAWPFGLAAWLVGVVFIDRSKGGEALQQMKEVSQLTKTEKIKLWVYPEGTRNQERDNLLPFKRGAFKVAVYCQAPIIPVVFSPYYFLDPKKKHFGQGRVIVQVLEPISTEGMSENDVDRLVDETRELMVKQFELLKEEVMRDIVQKLK